MRPNFQPLEIGFHCRMDYQPADDAFIRVKAGIFYKSLMPGCACAGDPTEEDTQNEHITVLVSISRTTAEAAFQNLEE